MLRNLHTLIFFLNFFHIFSFLMEKTPLIIESREMVKAINFSSEKESPLVLFFLRKFQMASSKFTPNRQNNVNLREKGYEK